MKLKPKLKLRTKDKDLQSDPLVAFNALVKEAMEVTQALNALDLPHVQRPNADALFQQALAVDHIPPKNIAKLRAAVESGEPGLEHTRSTLRRMIGFLRSTNWSGVPKEPARLRFLSTDATTGELIRIQSTLFELYCLAIQIAGEQHPEAFGSCPDPAAVAEKITTLRTRQRELFNKIGPALASDDSKNVSPDASRNEAGQRLVAYLLAQAGNKSE